MKKLIRAAGLLLGIVLTIFVSSCNKDEFDGSKDTIVSQFVYDGMSTYYLWADEITAKEPTENDTDPTKYFQSLLNSTDKKQGWSYITNDVQKLLAGFSGEPKSFGFSVGFEAVNATEYVAFIQYVFPNTPASNAGLKRTDFIGKINGQPITQNNYRILYSNEMAKFTMYKKDSGNKFVDDKEITLTPAVISTDPVLYKKIFDINGKKIAYLFYTDFIQNYNNSLYDAFSEFKQAGVTDLILDLRYNHGGALSAAIYLSSLIVRKTEVEKKSPFAVMSYNSLINSVFDREKISRIDSLGVYSPPKEQNPLNANLNLGKVYIIATDDSYSASELVTFCLKSYVNVVHIGGNTGGKYTASWTIHPYDETLGVPIYDAAKLPSDYKTKLKNWAMQPIVGRYTNCNNQDFSVPGYLVPDHSLKEGGGYIDNWVPFGDTNDVFLGQALYLITGDGSYKPAQQVSGRAGINKTTFIPLHNPNDVRKEAVILDNVKLSAEELRKVLPYLQ